MVRRIKPVSRIVKIEKEINKIFGEVFFPKSELLCLEESWVPLLDVIERAEEIVIIAELPGIHRKDVTIILHNNRIEIKGIKKESLPSRSGRFLRLEREYGTFRRFVSLPGAVLPEDAAAALENGVLTITLKKQKRMSQEVVVKIRKSEEK